MCLQGQRRNRQVKDLSVGVISKIALNHMYQNPIQVTCRKFMENKKKGLYLSSCFWYCATGIGKEQRMKNFEEIQKTT